MFSILHSKRRVDSDAKVLFDRGTFDDSSVRAAINNMIVGLKADGVWSKLDVLNVVSPIEADSLLNVVTNDYDSITENDVVFTADRGFLTTKQPAQDDRILIDFQSVIDGGNFTQTSNSLGTYYNIDSTMFSLSETLVSASVASIYQLNATEIGTLNHEGGSPSEVVTASDCRGFVASARTAGTGSNNLSLNYRGTETLFSVNVTVAATNAAGCGAADGGRIAMWFFGGGMTNTELNYIKARTETYLASRGATY